MSLSLPLRLAARSASGLVRTGVCAELSNHARYKTTEVSNPNHTQYVLMLLLLNSGGSQAHPISPHPTFNCVYYPNAQCGSRPPPPQDFFNLKSSIVVPPPGLRSTRLRSESRRRLLGL